MSETRRLSRPLEAAGAWGAAIVGRALAGLVGIRAAGPRATQASRSDRSGRAVRRAAEGRAR